MAEGLGVKGQGCLGIWDWWVYNIRMIIDFNLKIMKWYKALWVFGCSR